MDDAGNVIKLAHPAQRIISLAPDLTEILFAAGAGNKIVGTVQGSDFPTQAQKIPVVATFNGADLEKILALSPDLIVVWSEGSLARSLQKLGIPVFLSHQTKLTDIPRTIKRLGCLAGTEKTADHAAMKFMQKYTELQKKFSHKKNTTVFFEIWPKPLITVSKHNWINDAIELCGGKNIFADLNTSAPEVNMEAVFIADPDIIFGTEKFWQEWPQLKAVKLHHVFEINSDQIERAGPRILEGVEIMCNLSK